MMELIVLRESGVLLSISAGLRKGESIMACLELDVSGQKGLTYCFSVLIF